MNEFPVDFAEPAPCEDCSPAPVSAGVSSLGLSVAPLTIPAIFFTKSIIVLAVFLKKYSFTTTNGTLLSMSSIERIASNEDGVMAIWGQVFAASDGRKEYIVQPPVWGPYGLNNCWSPSCIIAIKPVTTSAFIAFQPIVLFLSSVV